MERIQKAVQLSLVRFRSEKPVSSSGNSAGLSPAD